jgi:hypothetical protein
VATRALEKLFHTRRLTCRPRDSREPSTAVNHPDRVAGLVLIGAPLSLAKPAVLTFQAAVHALEDPVPAPVRPRGGRRRPRHLHAKP